MITVVGYGNSLRGDDGFGIYVGEALLSFTNVILTHQLTPELIYKLENSDFVIFIDAGFGFEEFAFAVPLMEQNSNTIGVLNHNLTPFTLQKLSRDILNHDFKFLIFSILCKEFSYSDSLSLKAKERADFLIDYLISEIIQKV